MRRQRKEGKTPQEKIVRIVGSGDGRSALELSEHEVARVRNNGASTVARLLRPAAEGGGGFRAALTSAGRLFTSADKMHAYVVNMGGNGYWNQEDMWFAKDLSDIRRARRLICLRRQSHQSESTARRQCESHRGGAVSRAGQGRAGQGRAGQGRHSKRGGGVGREGRRPEQTRV